MRADTAPLLEVLETLRPKLDPDVYKALHMMVSRLEFQTQQIAWLIQDYETNIQPTLEKHNERLTRIEETPEIAAVLP